jgi:outer membrane lipoprotein-sorting protein
MKNETKGIAPLIIAVVVVVVVAVAGVGVYVATRGGGGGGENQPSGGDVGSATSLSYDITETSTGSAFTFKAKDIGSSNMKMRIEGTFAGMEDIIYIINGATQTMWMSYGGTWTDMSSYYSTYFDTYSTMLSGYQTDLGSWTGSGNITVGTVTISNIQVNPTLADSLFTH